MNSRIVNKYALAFSSLFILVPLMSPAQEKTGSFDPNGKLTPANTEAVVKRVAAEFRDKYVIVDAGNKMAEFIEQNYRNRAYDPIVELDKLAAQIQADLRSISGDKHIKVIAGQPPQDFDDPNELHREHYGFKAADILRGNIGYVNFNQFYDPKLAAPTAIAAMNFLADCDALIIDLRENGGGYPELSQILCSYFFDKPVFFMERRFRNGSVEQEWTLPYVPGPKMPNIPIYVLISRLSFSCAEHFAFGLQNLKRATVIGETSGGGAHPVDWWSFPSESISLRIPYAEGEDPVTKKTWERTGVQPDVQVPASTAKQVAVIEAVKALLKSYPQDKNRKYEWEWVLRDYETQLTPFKLEVKALAEYAGRYGDYRVALEEGRLYLYFKEQSKKRLEPIEKDGFKRIKEEEGIYADFRLQFTRDGSGRIKEFYIHAYDGERYPAEKRDGKDP